MESGDMEGNEQQEEGRVAAAQALAASAVARYRDLVASGPGIVPEMVGGETLEEIDASVEGARRAYEEISRRVTEQLEQRIPAGNPARSSTAAGAEWLKPEAKIALGLRGK
ncbi:MAG TPA: hypothetical protein VM409_01375 [Chloroflexia bacterium]|nr:hypothetical protein [Chloroflexia bacterium]